MIARVFLSNPLRDRNMKQVSSKRHRAARHRAAQKDKRREDARRYLICFVLRNPAHADCIQRIHKKFAPENTLVIADTEPVS